MTLASKKIKAHKFNNEVCRNFMISPYADIVKYPLSEKNDFIIIACDGIWDVYTNSKAITLAY